jgi:ATP-dependent Zn protease
MAYMKKMAMHETVNLISADENQMSSEYNAMLEREASTLLLNMIDDANTILMSNHDKVERLAHELMTKETLDLQTIKKLLGISAETKK